MRGPAGIWKRLWLVALLLSPLGLVHGSDLEQRLERLEAQLERILQHLERQSADEPASAPGAAPTQAPAEQPAPPADTPGPEAAPAPAVAPAPPPAPSPAPRASGAPSATPGEVRISYFMDATSLSTTPPATGSLASGLHTLEGDLRMDPYRYGAAERRLLTGYRDASEHRAVGILLEGYLEIPQAGMHRFEVAPKPAREGGESRVSNEMTVHLWVNGEPVIALEGVRGWRHQMVERSLPAGRHPFRLWVVSNSPGYGAPPIDSRLGMTVSLPGRAQQTPLWRLMTAPE